MSSLLKTQRFMPLFFTQFLGAFNDNVFKNALVMLITYKMASGENGDAQILVTLAAGLFILPFLLFSALAGQLADKYDRARMARITKITEIVLMVIASIGFLANDVYFLLFVLFCLGAQATFFGPIKYALLPQHLKENELITGNAYIEAGTFLAILSGTIVGGLLIVRAKGSVVVCCAIILFALMGYLTSRYIPLAPPPMPKLKINWNIFSQTWSMIQHDRTNRRVFRAILGISWFWLLGATYLSQFPTYAKNVVGGDATVVTLFLTVFSVGIGIGSALCNRLLKGEVKSTLVVPAALGMSLFTFDLYYMSSYAVFALEPGALMSAMGFIHHAAGPRILFDLMMIAVCGGLYIVPLYAIMQHDSDPEYRARTIATNNVLNAVFMVASALATVAMLEAHFTVPQVFLTVGALNVLVVFYMNKLRKSA